MKKLLRKWCEWRVWRRLVKVINDYDAGYADGYDIGYDKGHEAGWLSARNFPEGCPLQ